MAIFQTPNHPYGFFLEDHTVGKLSVDTGSLCSEMCQTSWPQVILKSQPPICFDYMALNEPQLTLFLRPVARDNPWFKSLLVRIG